MSESITFFPGERLTVAAVAELVAATPRAGDPLDRTVDNVAALDHAGPRDLTFFDGKRLVEALPRTRAAACLTTAAHVAKVPAGTVALAVARPYHAFVAAAGRLYPASLRPASLFGEAASPPGAAVHPTVRLEAGVAIDPNAVIGAGAEIGAGTLIGAGAVIGPGVRIGRNCAIGAGCTVTHALIGDGVVLHPGCRIGQDGFGYVQGRRGHEKVPQLGRVIIQDGVEIGANTTVDRGGLRDTIIGEGTKIDNLVQIGHNVSIGRHCLVVAHTGISGSVTLEDFVVLGGQVGIADHRTIGEGAQIGAQSGAMTDIPAGERWLGSPAMPARAFFRMIAEQRAVLRRHGEKPAAAEGE